MKIKVKKIGQAITTAGTGYKAGDMVRLEPKRGDAYAVKPVLVANERITNQPFNPTAAKIVYTNGLYMKVGENGLLETSTDTVIWTAIPTNNAYHFTGAAFGNGVYVAVTKKHYVMVGTDPTIAFSNMLPIETPYNFTDLVFGNGLFVGTTDSGEIVTSADGGTWTAQTTSNTQRLNAVAFGGGQFVAVGAGGAAIRSTDGITWTAGASGVTTDLKAITYGLGNFVAVGMTATIRASADGITWATSTNPFGVKNLSAVVASTGSILAFAETGESAVSTTVTSFTSSTTLFASNSGKSITAAGFGNGKYVVAGQNLVVTSTNGSTWTDTLKINAIGDFKKVFYAPNGQAIALDSNNQLITSYDDVTWTSIRSVPAFNDLTYSGSVYVGVGAGGAIYSSTDSKTWTSRTSGTGSNLQAVSFVNNRFVAVGDSSTIITSLDGITWTAFNSDNQKEIVDFAFGNSTFVAVSVDGIVLTSSNGVSWTNQEAISGVYRSIIFMSSKFIVIGDAGAAMTSADGITWTARSTGTTQNLKSLTYNAIAVAVGDAGTIVTSSDGITWTARSAGTSTNLYAVLYMFNSSTNHFVAYGGNPVEVYYSANGISWSRSEIRTSGTLNNLNDVAYGNSMFVGVGESGMIASSTDGVFWSANNRNGTTYRSVCYAFGAFIAVGDNGAIMRSTDGINSTDLSPVTSSNLLNVKLMSTGKLIAVGANGVMLVSTDGINWITLESATWNAIVYGASKFVAISKTGKLYTSADGVTWSPSAFGSGINAMTFNGSLFVAVGDAGKIVTSADGITWTTRTSNVAANLLDVKYINSKYVAIANETVTSSTDGITWTASTSDTLLGAVYGNSMFVVVGSNSKMMTSTDGVEWSDRVCNIAGDYHNVIYDGAKFVAVGSKVITSTNGITWTDKGYSPSTAGVVSIAFNGTTYILSEQTKVSSSTDLITWTRVGATTTFTQIVTNSDATVYLAIDASNLVYRSTDGINYTATGDTYPNVYYTPVDDKFVLNNTTTAKFSTDGSTWYTTTFTTTIANAKIKDLRVSSVNTSLTPFYVVFGGSAGAPKANFSIDGSTWRTTTFNSNSGGSGFTPQPGCIRDVVLGSEGAIYGCGDAGTIVVGQQPNALSTTITWYSRHAMHLCSGATTLSTDFTKMGSVATSSSAPTTPIAFGKNGVSLKISSAYGTGTADMNYYSGSVVDGVYDLHADNIAVSFTPKVIRAVAGNTDSYIDDSHNYQSDPNRIEVIVGDGGMLMVSKWNSTSGATTPGTLSPGFDRKTTNIPSTNLNDVVRIGSNYVVCGDNGVILTSSNNGATWTSVTTNSTQNLVKFAFKRSGAGTHYCYGSAGAIFSSTDGLTWTMRKNPMVSSVTALIYAMSKFIATTTTGEILTAPSTDIWLANAASTTKMNALVAGASSVVAVGDSGKIFTSTNGTTWTSRTIGSLYNLNSVAYNGTSFVAVGDAGSVKTSSDVTNWVTLTALTTSNLNFVVASTKFVTANSNRELYTSATGATFNRYARTMTAVDYGSSLYVSVCTSGNVFTSTDLNAWVFNSNLTGNSLSTIVFAASTFVVVGASGVVFTSTNGTTWTSRTSGTTYNLNSVRYYGSAFTAVGDNGTMITSTNGTTWSAITTGIAQNLYGVANGAGVTVAIGAASYILRSTDNVTFTPYTVGSTNTTATLRTVEYFGSNYLAFGDGDVVIVSPDVNTFSTSSTGLSMTINSSVVNGSLLVLVGEASKIATSANGTTFTARTSGATGVSFKDVLFANSQYMAVGSTGTVLTSTDGITWTARSSGTTYNLNGVVYGLSKFVAVGNVGYITNSVDNGLNWFVGTVPSMYGRHYGNLLQLVGASGYALTAVDPTIWMASKAATSNTFRSVRWASYFNNFIAVGDSGLIATSGDGRHWTVQTSGTTNNLKWVNAISVSVSAVGDNGTIVASTNLSTWATKATGTTGNFNYVRQLNGLLLAGGTLGAINYSTDGINWSPATRTPDASFGTLRSITFGNNQYLIAGDTGGLITRNSINNIWFPRNSGTTQNLYGVVGFASKYVAIGSAGTVITSTDLVNWTSNNQGSVAWRSIASDATTCVIVGDNTALKTTDAVTFTPINIGSEMVYNGTNYSGTLTSVTVFFGSVLISGTGAMMSQSYDVTNFAYQYVNKNSLLMMHTIGSKFIAYSDSNLHKSSLDGLTWAADIALQYPGTGVTKFAFGDVPSTLVGVGPSGAIMSTVTGGNWIYRTSGVSDNLNGVTYGAAGFVAVGNDGAIVSSTDGIAWSPRFGKQYRSIAYSPTLGLYVGVGAGGVCGWSTDGTTFTDNKADTNVNLTNVVWSNSLFIATGESGKLVTSTDGKLWAATVSNTGANVNGAAYGNQMYVAVGNDGKLLTSPDKVVFTARPSGTTGHLNGVVYVSSLNLFVAIGVGGYIATSSNTMTWLARTSTASQSLNSIIWTGSKLVAVGNGGKVVTSTDGITWASQSSGVTADLNSVAFVGSTLVAVGIGGVVIRSVDSGITWAPQDAVTTNDLYSVIYGAGKFVLTGKGGVLRFSSDGANWTRGSANFTNVTYSNDSAWYNASTASGSFINSSDAVNWKTGGFVSPVYIVANGITVDLTSGFGTTMVYENAMVAQIMSVGSAGEALTLNFYPGLTSSTYDFAVQDKIYDGSYGVEVPTNMTLNASTLRHRHEGKVRKLNLSSTSNLFTDVPQSSVGIWQQFGFKTLDSNTTGSLILVTDRQDPTTTFNASKPAGVDALATNLDQLPGGLLSRYTCLSDFPKKVDTTKAYATVKVNLVNTTTGAVVATFPYSYAKMSADGTEVACSKNNGTSDTEVAFYVNISGTWTKTWSATVGSQMTGMDFSSTSKDTIVVYNQVNGIRVFKRNSGLNTFSTGTYVIGTGYYDYTWTRASDSLTQTHGIMLARSNYAPFGDIHVSADGTKVCVMAMSHLKTGGTYSTTSQANFSPYPVIFDLATATVVKPLWKMITTGTSQSSLKIARFTSSDVNGATFYANDYTIKSYDITPDFSTIAVVRGSTVPGNLVVTASLCNMNTDVILSRTVPVGSDAVYGIKVSPSGTKYAVGSATSDYKGQVVVAGVGADATFDTRLTTGTAKHFGASTVFSKDGSTFFAGDPMFNRVTTGTSAIANFVWSIYNLNPEFKGSAITNMVLSATGGQAIAVMPNLTTHGYGFTKSMTELWPYFTTAGGGSYCNPTTISIEVVSIT